MIISVVGLGYVGLPLAIAFGKKYKTIGFDVQKDKVNNYKKNFDPTGEVDENQFQNSKNLSFTTNINDLKKSNFIIVAVPTPVDKSKTPDLSILKKATTLISKVIKSNTIVIYESTVYPGATEEVCIPILENYSNLKWKKDFYVGYSPERINPGDKNHTLEKIVKVISADTKETLKKIKMIYSSIIDAGLYVAPNIKVAEAAKVIENTQRDLNIALMNEFAMIFKKMDIDTNDVLNAAKSKWNFLPFSPGLVGGHCVDVDPYYLTYKAQMLGHHPQVILSGRKINDEMPFFIARETIKKIMRSEPINSNKNVLILGITFKENCSDLRNSKVPLIASELKDYGYNVFIHDPMANESEVQSEYAINLSKWEDLPKSSAMIAAVCHDQFLSLIKNQIEEKLIKNGIFVDVKSFFPEKYLKKNKYQIWRI